MSKSMIIIGGGIAGLATGCYAQMNGYKSTIFEAHHLSGGVCTAWKRKDYLFDGCLHWLVGSGPHNEYYKMWEELGAVQNRTFVNKDALYHVEGPEGKSFSLSCDPDQLERQMIALSPDDEALIREFTGAIRRFTKVKIPLKPQALMGPIDGIKAFMGMRHAIRDFKRFGGMSIQEYTNQLHDSFLRAAMLKLFDMPDFPIMAIIATLAWMYQGCAGYPLGGSLAFAQAIDKRYHQLGGEIQYHSKVNKILVEDGRAVGVLLEDGRKERADIIVSAADGFSTIFRMLEGRFVDETIEELYRKRLIFDPLIQVSLGVRRVMAGEPSSLYYSLKRPIQVEGQTLHEIGVNNYSFDPSAAPAGGTVLTIALKADYDYWNSLLADREQYETEKKKLADQVIDALEERYPGIRQDIDVVDVATPHTCERYTGNWRGAFEGWFMTTENFGKAYPDTLPGLTNFFMVGQWIIPGGGVPAVAKNGRDLIAILCHGEKRPFVTSVP